MQPLHVAFYPRVWLIHRPLGFLLSILLRGLYVLHPVSSWVSCQAPVRMHLTADTLWVPRCTCPCITPTRVHPRKPEFWQCY